MTISVTISGTSYQAAALSTSESVDGRSQATVKIRDLSGSLHFEPLQAISIACSETGYTFEGYIDTSDEINLTPNPGIEHSIACVDSRLRADKRYYAGPEFINKNAGHIVGELLASTLAQEGLEASYAARSDVSINDWQQGVLSGVSALDNARGLELTPAGTDIDQNFSSIPMSSFSAIKLTGYASSGYSSAYAYRSIWRGSQVIASGDSLAYDLWISSSSPEIKAGIDLLFSDGTRFSQFENNGAGFDGQGLGPNPNHDLSGFANDTWYARNHGVQSPIIGKTLVAVLVGLGGAQEGNYTAYFRRIRLRNGATTKITFFTDNFTVMTQNVAVSTIGYSNVSASVVSAYDKTASDLLTISLNNVGIVKSSVISYQTQNPASTDSKALGTVQMLSSIDNNTTFQSITNNAAIGNLTAGTNVSGQTLNIIRSITHGAYPDLPTRLATFNVQVESAPTPENPAFVSDVYAVKADFDTGTYTNAIFDATNVALTLNGQSIPYSSTSDYNGKTTTIGPGGVFLQQKRLAVNQQGGGDVRVRLDTVGSWQNFIAEVSCTVSSVATDGVGFCYRTTGWGTGRDQYAYSVTINQSQVLLGKGSNSNSSSAGTFTSIASVSPGLSSGSTHTLKVVVTDTLHQVYLDDALVISATDSTYTGAGQFGLRYWNSGGSPDLITVFFTNFGVARVDNGYWTSPPIDLSSIGTYGRSLLAWDTFNLTSNNSVTMKYSLNGGTTFIDAVNNAPLPTLTTGQYLVGTSIIFRMLLAAQNVSQIPVTRGFSFSVYPQYSASGYRISFPLNLAPVGFAGSASVSWDGVSDEETSVEVATGFNGSDWSVIGDTASGSAPIAGIVVESDPYLDDFSSNSAASYLSISGDILSGGGE